LLKKRAPLIVKMSNMLITDDSSETFLSDGLDFNALLHNNIVKPIQVYDKEYYKESDKREPIAVPSWRMKERVLYFSFKVLFVELLLYCVCILMFKDANSKCSTCNMS